MNKISKPYCLLENENKSEQYHVWLRPFCVSSLIFLSKFNNVYLFTKASEKYTEKICNKTNINKYFISKNFAKCSNSVCKDLNLIYPNVKNEMILLIDDNKINNCNNQNIYHISNYTFYKKYDIELLLVCFHILKINMLNDIKQFLIK